MNSDGVSERGRGGERNPAFATVFSSDELKPVRAVPNGALISTGYQRIASYIDIDINYMCNFTVLGKTRSVHLDRSDGCKIRRTNIDKLKLWAGT